MTLIPRGTAILSPDGVYRVWLERELGGTRPLVSIGLNPSTADAEIDDQTMRKEQGFARRWGCGLLIKVNLYAYRATKPKDMWAAQARGVDIVGGDGQGLGNDNWIRMAAARASAAGGILLCAWGGHGKPERVAQVIAAIREVPGAEQLLKCLGTNNDGSPKHTLYLPYETPLVDWRLAA